MSKSENISPFATISCKNCLKGFSKLKSLIKHAMERRGQKNFFCSANCKAIFNSLPQRGCLHCLQFFTPKQNTQKFCSQKCSASLNNTLRLKVSRRPAKKRGERNKSVLNVCFNCSKSFFSTQKVKACSSTCRRLLFVEAGLKSAANQSSTRRSLSEILLSELLQKAGFTILCNYPLFNGWDADIIIPDLKIAVLWNGNWHYNKITKRHSVIQVQNRDKIKLKAIISYGFTPYVIKDVNKFDEKFVQNEFQLLTDFISFDSCI